VDLPATENARPTITIIAVGAVKHTLPEIAHAFSKQFDCKVELSFGTAGFVRSKVEAGGRADVLITVAGDLPGMRQKALIEADIPVQLGVMRMGMISLPPPHSSRRLSKLVPSPTQIPRAELLPACTLMPYCAG
jgi:ABC-type molybdate transport system substrate-binding protein